MNRKGSEFLDVGGVFSRRPQDVAGLERAERLEGREGGLYKGGVLIIQKMCIRDSLRRLRRIPDGRTYLSRKGSPQTGMHYARPSSFSKETGFGALTHLLPEPGDGLRIR